MRRLLVVAAALIVSASNAAAGDFEMPVLRGSTYEPTPFVPAPPIYSRWSGFYAGGQVGYGSAHVDFSDATQSLLAFGLRELALENEQHVSQWQVLGTKDTGSASGGVFAGYNSQWDDVIVGVELMYNKTKYSADAPSDPIGRVTSAGGNTYDVDITGNASMHLKDYGTARVRAGYVMGTFMPWMAAGVAVGRMDYQRSVTLNGIENFAVPLPCGSPVATNCVPFTVSQGDSRTNAIIYGWTAGAGFDMMIMPHVFVRAEYEFTSFVALAGIKTQLNTGRLGVGVKF